MITENCQFETENCRLWQLRVQLAKDAPNLSSQDIDDIVAMSCGLEEVETPAPSVGDPL